MDVLRASVNDFGGDPSALHLFDGDGPELLPYATLMTARHSDRATLDVVKAVYEWQGAPLAFLVDADSLRDDHQLHRIRRLLAMRGDAPYVAVIAPGHLDVYHVALDGKDIQDTRVDWEDMCDARPTVFPRLGNMRPEAARHRQGWISDVIVKLLTGSMTSLINFGVSHEDAISLVGRALFTRFLADRSLLPDSMCEAATVATLFDTCDVAEKTSRWLDEIFNGDLLPLAPDTFKRLSDGSWHVLGDILRKAPDSQLFLGWEEKWDNLDFAHIPVGVLSQAYEIYLRKHRPNKQKSQGGYFTPGPIAELMVRASFYALEDREIGKSAKVLDPAVGGGVFLLAAFRELVAEHWRADRNRPDTNVLRRILYNQLVGFDINEAAIRFAALALYLLAIELDPDPRPVDKLGFNNLRGTVLHRVKDEDAEEGKELGSLGPLVGEEHVGRYDVVVGNPPWASQTQLSEWNLVRETVGRIAAGRPIMNTSPPLPNEALDLPFVWRAMEWAKRDGQITFALHARLLFQQNNGMRDARQALFEALDVTSVINGADLRQTRVWPQVSAPFCILFATNRKPDTDAGFRFISPRIEKDLNAVGIMRIDAQNADVVSPRQLFDTPEILKILFRGTRADLKIVERIRRQGYPTLTEFWRRRIGVVKGNHLRGVGNGYQTLKRSSRVRSGELLPGADARYLHDLPEITVMSFANIFVETKPLNLFSEERIHDPRSRVLFNAPLVVVHKSPPARLGRIGVTISEKDVVYNETFYGYSPGGDSDAGLLVRYLALILGSKMTVWLALVTSGEFGFERDVIEKSTLDRIPLPDFEKLTERQRREVNSLVEELHSGKISWKDVDEWVMGLYGLSQSDRQVISDTLEYGLPFAVNKQKAQSPPTIAERDRFRNVLRDELSPWYERFGSRFVVEHVPSFAMSPWQAIQVRNVSCETVAEIPVSDWAGLLEAADKAAASEILVDKAPDRLLVGRLAQRRYWSETQARLLAQHIIWSRIDFLRGGR